MRRQLIAEFPQKRKKQHVVSWLLALLVGGLLLAQLSVGAAKSAAAPKSAGVNPLKSAASSRLKSAFSAPLGRSEGMTWQDLLRYTTWNYALATPSSYFVSITVTTTADTIDAAGNCVAVTLASLPGPDGQTSLREAICAANSNVGADVITFSINGTFTLTGVANEDNGGAGDFDIKQSLNIQGNGITNTILDGSGIERIFDVFPAAASTFDLSNLTLQNGDTRTPSFKEGGAIYLHNNVTATFDSIQVINNFSASNGAIENRGNLTINNSLISNNQNIPASGNVVGGGIHNAGTLSINNTTISNNTVRGEGGGIATTTGAGVTVTITNTTISGNTASVAGGGNGNGGGISTTGNQGTINLTNCTISGNRADVGGGGAYFVTPPSGTGNVNLNNVTITNNTADNDNNGSGAGGGLAQDTAAVTLRNTLVAGNFNSTTATRDDISGAVVGTSSYNLIGDGTGSSGITNGTNNNQVGSGASPLNPLLGSLMNNGGPTETHALLTGSPAINTANNATAAATDQRGVARPSGGVADIGAYEVSDITPPDTTITGNPTNPSNSTSATFTFTGSDNVTPAGSLTFQCQIDGGGFSACTSPRTFTGLANGSHTFQVRAVDAANNIDPTPASYAWTIDATAPTVSNVTSTAANGLYTTPAVIDIQVVFTEAVNVVGTPQLTLETGATDAVVNYFGGSGSNTLIFRYIVAAGHTSPDLEYASTNALALNGSTIRDAATNNANLLLPFPGSANSLGANKALVIDAVAPTVAFSSAAPNPTNTSPIPVTVNFSENVSGFIAQDITVGNGMVNNFAGSGSTYTFDLVPSGQGLVTADIAAGVAQDAAGNLNTAATQFSRTYDSSAPDTTITANPTNPSVSANASFSFTGSDPGGSGVTSFQCQLDGGGFSACPSPQPYTGLSDGLHTFQVRAVDAAGNTDPTPASYTWTIVSPPTLGDYASTPLALSGNATVAPVMNQAPTNAVSATATTSSAFKGQLEVDPATGVVRVTNAHPAGNYVVTVSAYNAGGTATKTFNLMVNTSAGCGYFGATSLTGTNFGVSTGPRSVAVGDFNGDGRQDLVTANNSPDINTVSVLLRNSANTDFDPKVDYPAGNRPQAVAVGDLNGDGRLDIIAGNRGSSISVLFRNSANNGFDAPVNLSVANDINNLAVGDLNGDGKPDIAATISGTSTVSVFYRNSDNTGFDPRVDLTATAGPNGVTIADFNGDGRADLVVVSAGGTASLLYRNAGNTGFDLAVNLTLPTNNAYSVAAGDFNGDGRQDFVVGYFAANFVSVHLRKADNSDFDAPVNLTVNIGTLSIAVGDFNHDGRQDIATANGGSATAYVLLRTPDNTGFQVPLNFGVGSNPQSIAVGDFNGDNRQDLVTANNVSNNVTVLQRVCDTTPPDTTITANPANPSASTNASFSFTGNDGSGSGVVGFECQLDGGGFSACTSPQTYTSLSQGSHTFQVRAVDAAGNTDSTPASFTWVIDTVAPDTTITANPTNPSASANASFSFTGSDPGGSGVTGFECQLDGGGFGACTSPRSYTGLSDGSHTFQVRAVDAVGNTDPTPASFTWVIDTIAPDTTITANPTNPSASANASFSFTGNDGSGSGVSGFECQLDGGGFGACTSPRTYTGLSDGSHTFRVRAVDTAGNADGTPASFTWVIDTTPPPAPVVIAPANGSSTNNTQPVTSGTAEPLSTVTVFIDGTSTGVASADASGNWTLTLPTPLANGAHTVRARAADAVGNTSVDSNTNTFIVDTVAPDTTITANPTNPSNSLNASFSFTGNDGSGSGVAGFQCQLDGGGYSACTSPKLYTGLMDGSHTFQVRALDAAGNTDGTPASFTWVVDAMPPDTTITANPTNPSNSANASFSFTGNDGSGTGVASFQCQLDGGGFSSCTSPQPYTGLANGSHTFQVRAIDVTGNADPTPASFTWLVDTISPDTTITANPTNPSASSNVSFSFTGSDPGGSGVASFQCQLDGGGFSACTSPKSYSGLSDGSHTFQVRAVDAAGNVDATPANFTWVVDATPPDTTIASNPPNPSGSTTAAFTFTGNDSGGVGVASFQCQLDGGGFSPCTSPQTYTGLSLGSHTFQVRALDGVGNVDSTPASYTWVLNAPPTIVPLSLSRAAGSQNWLTTIATATDVETPNNQLVIQVSTDGTNFFDTVTANNVTVALDDQDAVPTGINPTSMGGVKAWITTPCNSVVGPLNLYLRVTDSIGQTDTKPWPLTILANPAPVLTYAPQSVVAGGTAVISPATGPSDNGTFSLGSPTVAPNNGGLTVSVNPGNGQVTILNAPQNGVYLVTVPVTDNCGATNNAQLTVTVICPAVTLTPAQLPNASLGASYSATVTASPSGTTYSYLLLGSPLPPGLSLDSATGLISGTPTAAGNYAFVVTALGWGDCRATQTYNLLVTATCPSVSLTPGSLASGTVGTSYSQSLTASGATGPFTWAVTSGSLPAGLSLASGGSLSGTPTAAGSFIFTVTATNGSGCAGSQNFTLVVTCPTLTLEPASLTNATVGVAYNQSFTLTPSGAATFSLATGSLPPGLNLSAAGVLSGTATATGSYSFSVKAERGSCSVTKAYTLVVSCPTVAVNPTSLANGAVGSAYNQSLSATPSGSYSFVVSAGTLPGGVTLSTAGVLSGTPTASGTFSFTVRATAFGNCSGTRNFTLTIGAACPTVSLPSLANATRGVSYYGDLSGTTPSGSYTFSLSSGTLPPGLVIDNLFGALTGTPTTAGTFAFTLQATNATGCAGTRSYSFVVSSGTAARAELADYDGDGASDPALWSASDGVWRIQPSSGAAFAETAWGGAGDVTLLGDYDGDGKTDLAVFRPSNATWYVKRSSDGAALVRSFGQSSDVPTPGDYDGDGKTDLAVWRGKTGEWLIQRSSDGQAFTQAWGSSAAAYQDTPVAGDFDGDGQTDLAVFRRTTGTWLVKRSSDAQFFVKAWGYGTDTPVAADYDGDGRTDIAVWRGATGEWFVLRSSDGGFAVTKWGATVQGDVPVAGDYDGDGVADLTVWRAPARQWFIQATRAAATQVVPQGQASDAPVAARR